MLRVLDSFGTEPEFNHAHYAQSKGHKTPWGKWNLNPQQFNTMFRKSHNTLFPKAPTVSHYERTSELWLKTNAFGSITSVCVQDLKTSYLTYAIKTST